MRLQAFLARAGAAPSRRKAETLIEAGRVTVNDETATLGANFTNGDRVLLDGRPHDRRIVLAVDQHERARRRMRLWKENGRGSEPHTRAAPGG